MPSVQAGDHIYLSTLKCSIQSGPCSFGRSALDSWSRAPSETGLESLLQCWKTLFHLTVTPAFALTLMGFTLSTGTSNVISSYLSDVVRADDCLQFKPT